MGSMPKKWCNLTLRTRLSNSPAVQDRIFQGTCVVGLAAACLLETCILIEGSRRRVGLAYLKKHRAFCFASGIEQGFQKAFAKALPAGRGSYNEIFQFPFGGEMMGDQKSENARAFGAGLEMGRRCFHDQQEPWTFDLKRQAVLFFRPMTGGGRLPLQTHDAGNVSEGCGANFHGSFGVLGLPSCKLGARSWLHKRLRVRSSHVIRFQLLGGDRLASLQLF